MTPVLTAALAAVGVLPLSLRLLSAQRVLLAHALWLAVALGTFLAATAAEPELPVEPMSRPVERLGNGYVGSATCTKCHPGEHASWQHSFHRTMTQSVSRTTLRADFDDLQLDYFGAPVSLHWRGSELFVRLSPDARGRRDERKVVQLTGSHHAQVLWYETGNQRELGIVPMVYRIAEARWLPFPAVFLMPPQLREPPLPGTWNGNCNGCHTTHSMPRLDLGRVDTMAAEFGIACEACHGPGESHARANANPLRRYGLH
ncbi:MAG: multiheme c-type cytochrome, partial [Planctomycetota bacterium]